ncbi:hypothetical protein GCM10025760_37600 [Microbacterium yannicii]|uniref:DUF4190 domain-containing protein n=1 Tax=Microbacterium yannicii TaxID=671622 RepID=A0ABP9MTS3_9MICO|nr:hypothetical protein [Microbacterium yannicii]MCO5952222.1 hypothetical protein [Microbacterium yannicii]
MTEPSSALDAKVWLPLAAIVLGAVSIFFNPYLLVSVVAIVLGIVGLIGTRQASNQRTYRLISILGIVAGAIGALSVIVSNTISTM